MDDETQAPSNKGGKVVFAVFGALALLTCCGSGAWTGLAASGSESEIVQATYISTFPFCFGLSGLLGAAIGMFAFKGKVALQVILPLVLAFLGGGCGAGAIIVFFEGIFPSL